MPRHVLTPLRTEEPVKDALNIIEMVLLDILAMLEPVSKQRGARAAHPVKLLRQIRQVLQRRRRRLPSLRHLEAAAAPDGSPQNIAQDLAEDVAARHLWSARSRRLRAGLSAGYGNLHRPDNNRFDAALADPFLHLAQE